MRLEGREVIRVQTAEVSCYIKKFGLDLFVQSRVFLKNLARSLWLHCEEGIVSET